MAVVTAEELRQYMGGLRMREVDKASAAMILAGVQADLEEYLGRAIEPSATREIAMCDFRGVANLRYTPVSSVQRLGSITSSVSDITVGVLDPGVPEVVPDITTVDYVPGNNGLGLIAPGGVYVGGAEGSFWIVDYTHGGGSFFTRGLPQIKLGILRVAAREAQTMFDDTKGLRETVQTDPVDPTPPPTKGWMDSELARFSRYKRRVVST